MRKFHCILACALVVIASGNNAPASGTGFSTACNTSFKPTYNFVCNGSDAYVLNGAKTMTQDANECAEQKGTLNGVPYDLKCGFLADSPSE